VLYADISVGYAAPVPTLGERIKVVREAIRPKFTQGHLAKAMDVAQSAVSKWETDETRPDGIQLIRIAAALQCSVEDLVVGVDHSYDQLRKKRAVLIRHEGDQPSTFTRGGSADVPAPAASPRLQQSNAYEKALQDVIQFASARLVDARKRARAESADARTAQRGSRRHAGGDR
jgi:transcriptional regulator with XRE-family HTH domain